MQEFVIKKNDEGQRLDKYLTKSFPSMPKSMAYKFVRTKKIKVNRKRATPDQMLVEGDVVTTFIPYEFTEKPEKGMEFKSVSAKLDIVYEDANIILVNKPCGMSAIPDQHENENVLINHIKSYLYDKGEYDPDAESSFAPALCNRIDRNTGGIVIAAKTANALREINELIRERKITKKYLCVVHGVPKKKNDVLRAFMVKDTSKNLVTVFDRDPHTNESRTMITGYRVIADNGDLALLEVELFTGRTHQIRAHLAHIGHPLLGDGKYGINREDRKRGYKYQALYSFYLKLKGKEYTVDPHSIWFVEELFPNVNFDRK